MKKRIVYNAPVILTYTLAAAVVLALGTVTGGAVTYQFFTVFRSGWLDPLQYLRLFSHVLGHASFSHFFGNFMYILLLGPIVEEKYGSQNLLLMILFTALVTGLIQVIFFPGSGLLGASGVVFMLIVLASATNIKQGEIPLTMIVVAVLYVGNEIFTGITTADSVSQMAHVIGGVCGGGFGLLLPGKRR